MPEQKRDESPRLGHLVAQYAFLLHEHGPNSPQAKQFANQHADVPQFSELAKLEKDLKEGLMFHQ